MLHPMVRMYESNALSLALMCMTVDLVLTWASQIRILRYVSPIGVCLPNMVILVEDHCFGLGLQGDGCSEAGVQQQVVLCCLHLCVEVDCSMIPDLLEHDFPIVGEEKAGWSG